MRLLAFPSLPENDLDGRTKRRLERNDSVLIAMHTELQKLENNTAEILGLPKIKRKKNK